ncbi:MAG: hypothetical protein R3F43_24690 [bacterium]
MIGTLVGPEIPILTRLLSRAGSLRDSIAHVLSLTTWAPWWGRWPSRWCCCPSSASSGPRSPSGCSTSGGAAQRLALRRRAASPRRLARPRWLGRRCSPGMLYGNAVTAFAEGASSPTRSSTASRRPTSASS